MRLVMRSGVFGLKPSFRLDTRAFTRRKLQQGCARLYFACCTSLLDNTHFLLLLTFLSTPLHSADIARNSQHNIPSSHQGHYNRQHDEQ